MPLQPSKSQLSADQIPVISYKKSNLKDLALLPLVEGKIYQSITDLKSLGFEASTTYKAYDLWQTALRDNYKIVLGFTSNAISCGLRDLIALLCKYNLVHLVVTTGGGLEEDLIKSKVPARIHTQKLTDEHLYEVGVNRTQNLYFFNDGYVYLESFLKKLFAETPALNSTTVKELTAILGGNIKSESSYLHWCYVNKIPVLAGGVEDCAIGDYYAIQNFKTKDDRAKGLTLNSAYTLTDYLDFLFADDRKICTIILGGGFVKHFIMNGCIARGGSDCAIYLNNEPFYTGSNCGAPPAEAVSWGKLKVQGLKHSVKIHGDFLLPFYLMASEILKKSQKT